MSSYLEEAVAAIRARVGDGRVICGLSGGVDSSVVAALLARAVGEQSTAVFVDNGVLRKDEAVQVVHSLGDGLGLPIVKGLIDLHGGGFLLKSRPRAGTEVTVTLPAERVMDTLAAVPQPKPSRRSAA